MMLWAHNVGHIKSVRDVNALLSAQRRLLIPRLPDVADTIKFDRIPMSYDGVGLVEASLETASMILDQTPNPMVLWSGGVDSTLALAAILKCANPERILVGISKHTVKYANPQIINWVRELGCRVVFVDVEYLRAYTKSGGVFITGTHGDNLCLSDAVGCVGGMGTTLATDIWDMEPSDLMECLSGRANGVKMWDKYRWLYDYMPDDIPRDAPNCLWWTGYCFYWHRDSMYMTLQSGYGAPGITHHHFFSSDVLQRWMIQPVQNRVGRTKETHKNKIIDAIYSLVGFEFPIMQKTDGWGDVIANKSLDRIACIDDNFNVKYFLN